MLFRTFLDWLGVFVFLDGAVFDLAIQGKPIGYTLTIALVVSTIQIIITFLGFEAIISAMKKRYFSNRKASKMVKDFTKLAERIWKWLEKWRKKIKIIDFLVKLILGAKRHKYLAIFVPNLIPFAPYFTTATAIASTYYRKRKLALVIVIIGNSMKFLIFVPLYYLLA